MWSDARLCARAGLSVTECSNGGQAIEELKRCRYEVLLCDLKMAGMEGTGLLRRVRESCPDVAFVVAIEPQELRHGILAMVDGASGYIVMPYRSESLIRDLKVAVERHRLNRALAGHSTPPKKRSQPDRIGFAVPSYSPSCIRVVKSKSRCL